MGLKGRAKAIAVLLACLGSLWSVSAAADFRQATEHFRKGEYAEAMRELKPLVDTGDPAAMNAMGVLLENGHGVARDLRAAADLYRRAAGKGNTGGAVQPGTHALGWSWHSQGRAPSG